MFPILFTLTLTPTEATWVLFAAAVLVPAYYAYRSWQDVRAGLEDDRRRPLLIFVGGAALALFAVGFVVRPWTWQRALSLPLHTYGLMMATAFVAGITVASREARRSGLDADRVLDLSFWVLLSGLAGARILFIIVNWEQYFGDGFYSADVTVPGLGWRVPNILLVWRGGLVFFGGLIGAFFAITFYLRKHGLPYFRYLDAMAPSVPLGHFFGRLGCFSAGCCWGKPVDPSSPVATFFPPGSLAFMQTPIESHVQHAGQWTTSAVYPTQLFESLGTLLIFFALLWLRRRKRYHGQLVIYYFILYPIFRTINETFRGDWGRGMLFRWPAESPVMLSTSQLISALVAATGVGLLIYLKRQHATAPGEGSGAGAGEDAGEAPATGARGA